VTKKYRAIRGGSYNLSAATSVRAASRLGDDPLLRLDMYRFRCARAPH